MKLLLSLLLLISFDALAGQKVFYGRDGVQEINHVASFPVRENARAVAAMISSYRIAEEEDSEGKVKFYSNKLSLCDGERFNQQTRLAKCSGFLVRDDIIITAAHCVPTEMDCLNNVWAFGHDLDSSVEGKLLQENIYSCQKIIYKQYDKNSKIDFAIIQLDRPVMGVDPLVLSEVDVAEETKLYAIGHPLGTPLKASLGGKIRDNGHKNFFETNLDTFHGNSGSPVFSRDTGEVEGLLVRGENDYNFDEIRSCRMIKRCLDDECRGEDVIRISLVEKKMNELGL